MTAAHTLPHSAHVLTEHLSCASLTGKRISQLESQEERTGKVIRFRGLGRLAGAGGGGREKV